MGKERNQKEIIRKRAFTFGVHLGLRNLMIVYIRDDVYLKLEKEAEKRKICIETLLSEAVSLAFESALPAFDMELDQNGR